jgi:ArsR family transcriptional regulator
MGIDTEYGHYIDDCQSIGSDVPLMFTQTLTLTDVSAAAADCTTPLARAPLGAADADALSRSLKALADPARLKLVSIVAASADREACVCDLTEPLDLSQPTVSHHLKVLVDAGILERDKRGTWAYYRVVDGALDGIAASIRTL